MSNVHKLDILAEGLSDILERRLEGAPADHAPAPAYDALYGFLRVCQEQTNRFQWHFLLDRIHQDLGEVYETAYKSTYPAECQPRNPLVFQAKALTLSPPILQGLLDMLVVAQRFPEDRSIHIKTLKGIPTIITWVYHILGLAVHINLLDNVGVTETKRFGQGQPQVVIDVHQSQQISENSICLLNPGKDDILFHLSDEGEVGRPLEASGRRPLAGFARAIVELGIQQQGITCSDSENIGTLLHKVALDILYHGIAGFLQPATEYPRNRSATKPTSYGDSLDEFHSKLQDSPYNTWGRVENAI